MKTDKMKVTSNIWYAMGTIGFAWLGIVSVMNPFENFEILHFWNWLINLLYVFAGFFISVWVWENRKAQPTEKQIQSELRGFLDLHSNYLTDEVKQQMIDEYLKHTKS